jgi:hypothetical protein
MPKSNEEFLSLARDRFRQSAEAESRIRAQMIDALRFRLPENQWPENIRRQREQESRPCLSIDRLGNFVKQVVNDIRQKRPAGKVRPIDDQGDVRTAEALQGIIRQTERVSNADKVRAWAAEYAVSIGRGWYRIVTETIDEKTRDQQILVKRIKNPFTVYPDPFAEEPDYSDMEFCFVREKMRKAVYKERFPDSELASIQQWTGIGDRWSSEWVEEDAVYVAEYWKR